MFNTFIIDLENTSWGWEESTDLIGQTDSRITRIIDFPRVGAFIEEVPLMVFLPNDWEYKYSAMGEMFSGKPGEFIVNRSEANVASNIRVTISNNQMPNALGYRTSTGAMITLNSNTVYYGDCEDSSLDNNQQWWTLSNNGTIVLTHFGDFGSQKGPWKTQRKQATQMLHDSFLWSGRRRINTRLSLRTMLLAGFFRSLSG